MSNEEADTKLMEQTNDYGKGIDGTFLVRVAAGGLFALGVVYRGKPTHHRTMPGEPFVINKMKIDGCDTLQQVVAKLSEPGAQAKWPVPLKFPVLYDGKDPLEVSWRAEAEAAKAEAYTTRDAADAAAAEGSSGVNAWSLRDLSNEPGGILEEILPSQPGSAPQFDWSDAELSDDEWAEQCIRVIEC